MSNPIRARPAGGDFRVASERGMGVAPMDSGGMGVSPMDGAKRRQFTGKMPVPRMASDALSKNWGAPRELMLCARALTSAP